MLIAVVVQGLFKIFLAVIGICVGRYTLYLMDNKIEASNFGKWLETANDHAKGVYYGARIISVMLVIGFAFS